MEIRLLGPVRVRLETGLFDAGPLQRRAVLAALAVDAGRPVMMATLVDRVWGADPPAQARATLYSHVSRLRRLMRACHSGDVAGHGELGAGDASIRLVGRGSGYLLDMEPQAVDLHRFRRLAAAACNVGTDDVERVKLLGEALRLWSGPPMADLPGQWATQTRTGWQQERLDVAVQWAHSELRLGRSGELIGPVRSLLEEYPLAEPLVEVLIRALVAAGRDAEALEYYAATRARLGEELGVEPSTALRAVHQAMLRGELDRPATSEVPTRTTPQAPFASTSESAAPKPGVPAQHGTGPVSAGPPPRQLPRQASWFTGRSAELDQLLQLVPDPAQAAAVVIVAIDGMAGIGKTALAVYAAHRLVDRFPDGQLFIDLHGHTQGLALIEPAEALDRLLRDLGIPGTQIPTSLDARAALYRTRLADQQMLILLDNAATEAQVTPLLPGDPGCLVLVTSRRRLAGLDHTHTLSLDTLPVPDAIALFTQTAGEGRLAGQPADLVAELVKLCGRLPLAIRIAAARLRSHPAWHLTDLVQRLRDQQHRLGELEAGQRSVAAALDLSYHHLSPDQQQAYQLMGLHPGPEFDAYATAALLNTTLLDAGRVLDQILEAHLLQEPTPGRYRFHDLTRAHAAAAGAGTSTAPSSDTALGRLLDYYRHTAAAAMDAAYPYERDRRPQIPPAHTPSPDLSEPAGALAWLDTELPNTLAAAQYAADSGWPDHTWHLAATLHRHLHTRGRYRDAESLHNQALTIARATDHRGGELDALTGLGQVCRLQGRHQQALDHLRQGLEIARTTGQRRGELDALTGLGWVYRLQGQYEQAIDHLVQALEIAQTAGDRIGEANALVVLGHIHQWHGRYERAIDDYMRELEIARFIGDRSHELGALLGLGHVHRWQSRHGQALVYYGQALEIARTTGDLFGELAALVSLGHVHRWQNRNEQAFKTFWQVLATAREISNRNVQCEAQYGLGRLHCATGHPELALTHHRQALELATDIRQPADQARAHDGIAHSRLALNQHEQARLHWRHALEILTSFGTDHTDADGVNVPAIRAHLAGLDRQHDNQAASG